MKHGNILALFNAQAGTIAAVESIVAANASKYKILGEIFYIATPDIISAPNIVAGLKTLKIEFLFYYNNISTGSAVLANNGNPNKEEIKKILL